MNLAEFKNLIQSKVIRSDSITKPIILRGGKRGHGSWLFDFREVLLDSTWLDAYAEIFWQKYGDRYPFQVGGIEATGIGLVAAIVMKGASRGTPVNGFFVRKSRKKDGLVRNIEGHVNDTPIILVDDLINTGSSALKQILSLSSIGKPVEEFFCIVAFRDVSDYSQLTSHGIRISWLYELSEFGLSLAQKQDRYDTLKRKWSFEGKRPSLHHVTEKSTPILDSNSVYVGTDSGALYALSKDNGEARWVYKTNGDLAEKGIFSSPIIYKETVFFGSYDGNVYALHVGDGSVRWIYHKADWVGSSPTVSKEHDLVFIGLEFASPTKRGAIAALDAMTGEERWFSSFSDYVHCSPHYIENLGIVLCGDNSGEVRAFDARSGEVRWSLQTGGAVKASFAHDKKRGLVFFGSFDGNLYAVNAWSGHVAFTFKTDEPIFSTPLVENGTVYIASLDKRIYAIDTATGLERWHYETNGRIFASPIIAFGSLWIGSNDSCLYELDTNTGSVRSIQRFSERIVNAIAVDEAAAELYVPTVANELHCFSRINASQ